MNLARQAKTGIKWGVLSGIVNQSLSWLITIWIIRLLTPNDFAIIAINDIAVGILLIIGKLGFHGAIIRTQKVTKHHYDQVFTSLVVFNLILFTCLQLSAGIISCYFQIKELELLIRISSFSLLLLPFETVPFAIAYKEMLYKKTAYLSIIINSIQISVNLALALLGFGFWALAIGVLIAQTLRAIGYCIIANYKPTLTINFNLLKDFTNDSNFSFFTAFIWELRARSDTYFINYYTGSTTLGIYRIALTLAEKPVNLVGKIIQQVGLASFSKIGDNPDLVGSYLIKAVSVMSLFSFPIFFGLAAVSPLAVPLLLGEKWINAVLPLQILCIVQLVNALREISGTALFSIGKAKRKFFQGVVCTLIAIFSWAVMLNFGFIAGCIGFTASYIIWYIWHLYDTSIFIKLDGIYKSIAIPLLMSSFMYFTTTHFMKAMVFDSAVLNLILTILVGFFSYLLTGFIFFKKHCFKIIYYLKSN